MQSIDDVTVGSRWEDRDPRACGRQIEVLRLSGEGLNPFVTPRNLVHPDRPHLVGCTGAPIRAIALVRRWRLVSAQ